MTRIDKYLWSVRIYKTRSLASAEVKKGRVLINKKVAKPSSNIQLKDQIEVKKDGITYSYKVHDLLEKRVGAKLVDLYLINLTSEEEYEKLKQQQLAHQSYRQTLTEGKPSKKDKRDLKKFLADD